MATISRKTVTTPSPKRKFSGISVKDALQMVPAIDFSAWDLDPPPLAPSDVLVAVLKRLDSFDLVHSEAAKITLIDTIFLEVVPRHPNLKVWKSEPLETDTLTGFADYLIAPKRAYMETPLLCVAEAKKDDFEQGATQCVAEMVACRWNNVQSGSLTPVYGIVSNGTGWQFFCLTLQNSVLQSKHYATGSLSQLLGAIDYICGECAKNVSTVTI